MNSVEMESTASENMEANRANRQPAKKSINKDTPSQRSTRTIINFDEMKSTASEIMEDQISNKSSASPKSVLSVKSSNKPQQPGSKPNRVQTVPNTAPVKLKSVTSIIHYNNKSPTSHASSKVNFNMSEPPHHERYHSFSAIKSRESPGFRARRYLKEMRARNDFAFGMYMLALIQTVLIAITYKITKRDEGPNHDTFEVMLCLGIFMYLAVFAIFIDCAACLFSPAKYVWIVIPLVGHLLLFFFIEQTIDARFLFGGLIYLAIVYGLLALAATGFRSKLDITAPFTPIATFVFSVLAYAVMVTLLQLQGRGKHVVKAAQTFGLAFLVSCYYSFEVYRLSHGRYMSQTKGGDFIFGYFCVIVDLVMIPFDLFYLVYRHYK